MKGCLRIGVCILAVAVAPWSAYSAPMEFVDADTDTRIDQPGSAHADADDAAGRIQVSSSVWSESLPLPTQLLPLVRDANRKAWAEGWLTVRYEGPLEADRRYEAVFELEIPADAPLRIGDQEGAYPYVTRDRQTRQQISLHYGDNVWKDGFGSWCVLKSNYHNGWFHSDCPTGDLLELRIGFTADSQELSQGYIDLTVLLRAQVTLDPADESTLAEGAIIVRDFRVES